MWLGTFISMGGSLMRQAAVLWHVSLLAPSGHKALALGGVGLARFVPIVCGSLFAGAAAGTCDNPARSSFFPSLVPREHLPNAISLNSILFQAASVLGPLLAGMII